MKIRYGGNANMDMSNMQCKNVTFLSYKEENGLYKYTFKIVDNIANHIIW